MQVKRAFSHYQLLEELGRGGGGVVYLAEDTLLLRHVAIKFPQPSARHQRLLAEARAASALTHPAIAAVYDCGEDDGNPYIVMELVDGGSVFDLMRDGPLPVDHAVEIAIQVAGALREAHAHRIIHRDIKPSNIRLDRRGAVKVVDFGLAKTLSDQAGVPGSSETLTIEGVVEGTPRYMSPEQACGAGSDERTDLFSLGVVLYECLTGNAAFQGTGKVEILGQVLHIEPPLPSSINPAVPSALDHLVRKAMAKDRQARYQSAEEMLHALEVFRGTGEGPAIPDTRRRAWLRSAWTWAASVAVLAAAATAGWLIFGRSPPRPRPEVLRWYEAGTAAIRESTYYRASKALERAAELDPGFAPAQARLAEAYNELEDANRAQRAMLQAMGRGFDRLAHPDRLAIQAIHRVLTQDFAGAVQLYRTLLASASDFEKPAVYVDLGRAYEKAENIPEAMASYEEAARRAPEYPAAYLRLAVLNRRKQQTAAAAAAFDHAESLFNTLGNVEGQTEVVYQRAVQATNQGDVDKAAELIGRGRRLAESSGDVYHSIGLLQQLSLVDVRKGDTRGAEGHASEAVELARKNGLERLTSRGLVFLGNAFFVKGDARLAEHYLLQGLETARTGGIRHTEARALLALGSLHEQFGRPDQAEQEIREALPFFEHGGYERDRSQCRLLLGRISRETGKFAEARDVFQSELNIARNNGDRRLTAQLYEGLGETELASERYAAALENFQYELALTREIKDRLYEGYASLYCGRALWRIGRYAEANELFQKARGVAAGGGGSSVLAVYIDVDAAQMALSQLHPAEALAIAKRLQGGREELAVDAQAELQRVTGQAELRSGHFRDGEKWCRESLETARRSRLAPLTAAATTCVAEALLGSGDSSQALQASAGLVEECGRAGRFECRAAAAITAWQAARISRNTAAAKQYAEAASEALQALEGSLPEGDRRTFQSRPDIVQWRKSLGYRQ